MCTVLVCLTVCVCVPFYTTLHVNPFNGLYTGYVEDRDDGTLNSKVVYEKLLV